MIVFDVDFGRAVEILVKQMVGGNIEVFFFKTKGVERGCRIIRAR